MTAVQDPSTAHVEHMADDLRSLDDARAEDIARSLPLAAPGLA